MGTALIESLASVFNTSQTPRRVILGGHDRGARICHRLAVDFSYPPAASSSTSPYSELNLTVIGTILLDIVPTLAQWTAFADPAISQGYFHWPLLANADMAVDIISAYGGARWCREAHLRIGGPNPESAARISSDGALDVYAESFDKKETLYYSALDYAAGAAPEANEQKKDQEQGRKVKVPILVMFSKAKLGARIDVAGVWKDWVSEGVDYQGVGVGEGYGHYLPEEAYDIVGPKIEEFVQKVA